MSILDVDDLGETLRRLATAFTVRDIMVRKEDLIFAANEAQAAALLRQHTEFDAIPIGQGELSAYLERGRDHAKAIRTPDLVSDSTSILELVDNLQRRSFSFVLASDSIAGFVHFSDLNNRLVRLPYFVLLQSLETCLVEKAGTLVNEEVVNKAVSKTRLEQLKYRLQRQRKNRADLGWVSLLSFSEILECGLILGNLELDRVQTQLLSKTRNDVFHGKPLVGSHTDVKRLVKVRDLCISMLAGGSV